MTKSKVFIFLAICFLCGIGFGSFFNWPQVVIYICAAGLAVAAGICHKQKFLFAVCCGGLIFCLGYLKIINNFPQNQFRILLETKINMEGYVIEDPDIRLDKQLLVIRPKNYTQNILVTSPLTQDFFYGDEVVLRGKLQEAKNFSEFDYKAYLQLQNIYGLMDRPKILILKSHQRNFLKENILRVKHFLTRRLAQFFPEPQNSLLLGLLIGAKRTLPQNLTDAFNRVGLSHIVAVSGFNISVIVSALDGLAYIIGRRLSFWFSLVFMVCFVVMAGASASVLRAAVMGFLLLLSINSGRLYNLTPSLCATAAVMVWLSPKILFWDVGFQLSFLATIGIVYGMPLLEDLTAWWTEILSLKQIILTSLCAIIATMPLLLFQFGSLSLIALLANVLVLPLVPLAMLLGFLSLLPFFAPGFAFITTLLLNYIIFIVSGLAGFRYASLSFSISRLTFALLYGFIALGFYYLKQKIKKVVPETEV